MNRCLRLSTGANELNIAGCELHTSESYCNYSAEEYEKYSRSTPCIWKTTSSLVYPNLFRIAFRYMTGDAIHLSKLIKDCRSTLRLISLRDIFLNPGSTWADVLEGISTAHTLTSLRLADLFEHPTESTLQRADTRYNGERWHCWYYLLPGHSSDLITETREKVVAVLSQVSGLEDMIYGSVGRPPTALLLIFMM